MSFKDQRPVKTACIETICLAGRASGLVQSMKRWAFEQTESMLFSMRFDVEGEKLESVGIEACKIKRPVRRFKSIFYTWKLPTP